MALQRADAAQVCSTAGFILADGRCECCSATAARQLGNPSSIIHHPSSIIHHPSSIIHHPSSILHPPSSIIHHPSSIIHHPSSILHPPSSFIYLRFFPGTSILHHPSPIFHHPSSIIHHPSFIIHHPSSIIHHPSFILHHSSFICVSSQEQQQKLRHRYHLSCGCVSLENYQDQHYPRQRRRKQKHSWYIATELPQEFFPGHPL
jgi:hypothetical protein